MSLAKLIVIQPGRPTRELEILDDRVSIGRAPDNTVSLEGDSNVSRYHAEIEKQGDEFCLVDLDSSNGTTVNDEPVKERYLRDDDLLGIGGSSLIEFHLSAAPWAEDDYERDEQALVAPAAAPAPPPPPPVIADSAGSVRTPNIPPLSAPTAGSIPSARGPHWTLVAAGLGGGILITLLVAVVIYSVVTSRCNPTARIVNPQPGTTIRSPTTVQVEVADQKCIDRLIYQLDGQKLVSSEDPPYTITLDPERISGLDSGNHVLSVTVEDHDGHKKLQPETVLLAFETGDNPSTPEGNTEDPKPGTGNQQPAARTSSASIGIPDVKDMAGQLARRINAKSNYVFDADFLQQVQARTSQYARSVPLDRARGYRDVINEAFVGEQGLPAPLGYVMALCRSGFAVAPVQTYSGKSGVAGAETPQGLWQIQPSLVHLGACGPGATLTDTDQKCSATVTAVYMKALVVDVFNGDFVYAIATFSMQPKEASQFRDQLPPDRRDFWKMLKSAPQRDRVVSFFAAGIVGENPQRFNLAPDKSLTNLY